MNVSAEPCCRCRETCETVHHLFYDCRKSNYHWQKLREITRASHVDFANAQGFLAIIDEAIRAKRDGGSLVFIFHSLTHSIWKDRNSALFKNAQRTTPLLVSMELTRQELEGSLNNAASAIRWQRGQKAMKGTKQLD
ncbi:hypothetical protein R1flu_008917 [Riccia fluitans]|uniref:Reverse transcriptase zinc-binding domain-containing protein n=1 Tax=Riccia fluitans TaxID=41844 RepID=A0ABD1Z1G6_9MARC